MHRVTIPDLAGPVAIKSLHITIVMQRFISEISS
jgi:hypothetical protein